jgi:hypothetical protein
MPVSRRQRRLSATDIAALGHCETKLVLERKHGEVVTPDQAQARERGRQEHLRFDQAASTHHNRRVPKPSPSPCWIASAVYGPDCWRTNQLRAFRDNTLLPRPWGRGVVAAYYRLSPPVARWLRKSPRAAGLVRRALDVIRTIIVSKEGTHHAPQDA